MKVIVTESKIGVEYIADVISSCDQNGIECIVDDNAGDILYYEPKLGKYGNDKLLQNSDESIFDLVKDKERLASVLMDAQGDKFKEFAVQWNDLQKKGEDEEVYKTQHCNPIRGNFSERARNTRPTTAKDKEEFEKFRKRWKSIGKKKKDDEDEDYVDEFGLRVNGIEAQVSEGEESDDWSASEGEVEIIWDTTEFLDEFGMDIGDTETLVIDYDRVDTHDMLIEEVIRLLEDEYPGIVVGADDFVIDNEDEFWEQRGGNPGKWQDETDI